MKTELAIVHDVGQANDLMSEDFGWDIYRIFQEPTTPGRNSPLTFVLKRKIPR